MKELAEYISEGIEAHGYRFVFDNRLDDVFPLQNGDREKQGRQICAFAARNSWRVVLLQNGRMARFRALRHGEEVGHVTSSSGSPGSARRSQFADAK